MSECQQKMVSGCFLRMQSTIKVHAWDILRMIPDEEIAKIAKDLDT